MCRYLTSKASFVSTHRPTSWDDYGGGGGDGDKRTSSAAENQVPFHLPQALVAQISSEY